MTPELQKTLFERYPAFFEQRSWPFTQSCMPWGCETYDGWYSLIDAAAGTISDHAEANKLPVPQAVQIKEKLGGLRIYITDGGDFDGAVVDMAETLSFWVCEVSGKPGRLLDPDGWLRTLCPEEAWKHGIKLRVSMPRPSVRNRKYRSLVKGSIDIPRGWARIVEQMLIRLSVYNTTKTISINRIWMEDNSLRISAENVTSEAAGMVAFCQAVAKRADIKTGALHAPTVLQDGGQHEGRAS